MIAVAVTGDRSPATGDVVIHMPNSHLIDSALTEDLGGGIDITSHAMIPNDARATARIVAKSASVLAGIAIAREIFLQVDPQLQWSCDRHDGEALAIGDVVATIAGNTRALLRAERVALNTLQHLCGIATITRHCVNAVASAGIAILDTRKTLPGLRAWQKLAVQAGGGKNHRMGLFDRYLVKSNHLVAHESLDAALTVLDTNRDPNILLEVEVRTHNDIDIAMNHRADWIMLDNFSPDQICAAVQKISGRANIEVSGGITPENISHYAIPGITAISLGALTHSARAADLHMQLVEAC